MADEARWPPALAEMARDARVRVPCSPPLSRTQLAVAALLGQGWRIEETADILGVTRATLCTHMDDACARIPGDLPRLARMVVWWRGATLPVLTRDAVFDARDLPAQLRAKLGHDVASAVIGGRGCPMCGYLGVVAVEEATS